MSITAVACNAPKLITPNNNYFKREPVIWLARGWMFERVKTLFLVTPPSFEYNTKKFWHISLSQ